MIPFEKVVTDHSALVLRVCRAVVGPVDADDAWSETFLSALRAYPELPADADVRAWLVTIAHRKAVDVVRRSARQPTPVEVLPEPGAAEHEPSPVTDQDLYAALARLPQKQRQAVTYHYLAGMSYRAIAGLLGGTEAAARRAAADGVHALRTRHLHLIEVSA